jgi:hypothetical protein
MIHRHLSARVFFFYVAPFLRLVDGVEIGAHGMLGHGPEQDLR